MKLHLFVLALSLMFATAARPQVTSRDQARSETHERAGKDLLNSARDKFEDGAYWKSAIDLIIILDLYPIYSKLDRAIFMLGNCLYEMGLYDGADSIYRHLLKSVPKTKLVPEALLALQKVEYQRGDYPKSVKFYQTLEAHFPDHDVIDESRYYAIQSHYHMQNYTFVLNMTQYVDKNSEFYPFSLYTAGLTELKKKAFAKPWRILCG